MPISSFPLTLGGGDSANQGTGNSFLEFPSDTALNSVSKPIVIPAACTLLGVTIYLNNTILLTGTPAASLVRFANGTPDDDLLSDGDPLITPVAFPAIGSITPLVATLVETSLAAGDLIFPSITGGGTYDLVGFPVIIFTVEF